VAANRIYIQVDFQSQNATDSIKALNQQISGIGSVTQQTTEQASKGLNKMSVAVEQTTGDVANLARALVGLGAIRIASEMAKSSDAINKTQIAFEGMLNSATKAQDIMLNLRATAKTSPFAFQDLAEGAQKLKAFGFEAAKIPGVINTISNAAAALGGSKEKIDSIILAVGQMYTKGTAQGQELFRQLAEQGIKVMPALREAIKKETGQVLDDAAIRKLVEKGMLGGKAAADAILESMQKEFGSIGAKMMDLPTVQFIKLKDDLIQLGNTIMRDIQPQIVGAIKSIRDLVQEFRDADPTTRALIERLAELTAAWIALAGAMAAIKWTSAQTGLTWLLTNLPLLATTVSNLAADFTILAGAQGPLTATTSALIARFTALTPLLTGILYLANAIGAAFVGWKIGEAITAAFVALEEKYPGILDAINYLAGKVPGGQAITKTLTGAAQEQIDASKIRVQIQGLNEIQALENSILRERGKRIMGPLSMSGLPPIAGMDPDSIKAQNAQIMELIEAFQKEKKDKLIRENEALMQHLDEITQQALDRARAQMLGGLAAVHYEFLGKFNELQKGGEGPGSANWIKMQEAEELTLARIRREENDKVYAERQKLEVKAAEDRIALLEKEAKIAIDTSDSMITATAEQRADATIKSFNLEIEYAQKVAQEKKDLAQRQFEAERIAEFVRAMREGDSMRNLDNLKTQLTDAQTKAQMEADEKVAKHFADIQKQVIADTTELEKQAISQHMANTDAQIQHAQELAKLRREALAPQTEEQKTSAAAESLQAQLQDIEALKNQKIKDAQDISAQEIAAHNKTAQAIADSIKIVDAQTQQMHDEALLNANAYEIAQTQATAEQVQKIKIDSEYETQKAQLEFIKQYNDAVIESQRKTYDSLKSAMGQIFDALTHKGGDVFAALGNMAKAAILGALKEIVTSHLAAEFTELFGGGHVAFGGGRRGLLGSEPIFGQGKLLDPNSANVNLPGHVGAMPMVNAGGIMAMPTVDVGGGHAGTQDALQALAPGLWSIASAVRTVQPMAQQTSESMDGVPLGSPVTQQLPGVAETGGMTNLSKIPGLGQVQQASQISKALGFGSGSSILSSFGGAGTLATSLGGLMAGVGGLGLLGAYKLGRSMSPAARASAPFVGALGGLVGMGGLMAMFPALAAAGPVGWIAAAGIGAAVGLASIFGSTDIRHVRDLVKQYYGVDISNKQVLQTIVGIAKQKYGGVMSLAVASPEVQQIVQLYAATQGLQAGLPRPMYAATFAQTGAGLSMQPIYVNGQQIASPYTGMTTTQWSQAALYVQLDPQSANDLFAGRVVNVMQSNPATVAATAAQGLSSGSGRNDTLTSLMQPLSIMS